MAVLKFRSHTHGISTVYAVAVKSRLQRIVQRLAMKSATTLTKSFTYSHNDISMIPMSYVGTSTALHNSKDDVK